LVYIIALGYGLSDIEQRHRKLNVITENLCQYNALSRIIRTGICLSEEDTYIRAKLTEINGAIDRLTEMLNRMIDVISKIGEVQDATDDLTLRVVSNGEKIDEILRKLASAPVATGATGGSLEDKGVISHYTAVLDALEAQLREGAIASDLASKISEAADALEEKGAAGAVIVKMNRWVRILRTYGRIDSVSPTDLGKLRIDLKEWQKELAARR